MVQLVDTALASSEIRNGGWFEPIVVPEWHFPGRGRVQKQLQRATRAVDRIEPPPVEGVLTRMIGLTLEAAGCQAAVGDRCEVLGSGGTRVEAEVVGFSGDRLFLMPTGDIHGLKPNARVIPRTGAEISEDDVIAFCEQRLARYKCPQKVWFVDELPSGLGGKIRKHELR